MRVLLITIFILSCTSIISQNHPISSKLDEKHGFKDFKIGDDFNKWAGELLYTNSDEGGAKYYKYIGKCCNKIFSYDIETIRLGFKKDKLGMILLITPTDYIGGSKIKISDEFYSIKSNLDLLLEVESPITSKNSEGSDFYAIWMGKKILLILEYEFMGGIDLTKPGYNPKGRCLVTVTELMENDDLDSGF